MFPIVHASLALLDLLSILRGSDCLAIVGTEGRAGRYVEGTLWTDPAEAGDPEL
jgi:hypothetical protein